MNARGRDDEKDFLKWSKVKKGIHEERLCVIAHPRDIWWCALGANVGAETDGKNETFERPVVVMRVYNKHSLLVLPLTTRQQGDRFHFRLQTGDKVAWAKLTQTRVISSKRLLRKSEEGVANDEFSALRKAWHQYL